MAIHELTSKLGIKDKSDLPRPSIPIVNTAKLIGMIGEEWRMPTYEEIKGNEEFPSSLRTSLDKLIGQWMKFFDLVEKGNEIVVRTAKEGVVEVNVSAMGAWDYAREVMGGDFEQRREIILASRRAFQVLLGETMTMEPGDSEQARELVQVFNEHYARESSMAFVEAKIEKI